MTDFAIGVGDDVAGVGEDADHFGGAYVDASFFGNFADDGESLRAESTAPPRPRMRVGGGAVHPLGLTVQNRAHDRKEDPP
ncbi:hypothetical protein ACFYT3_04195 [Nocardia amikacinitolerans]|uniref:hypothetical protein n=1 Tax=Nocardia amikacinitolerans TaxID=756689 RepID=UPI0036D1A1EA